MWHPFANCRAASTLCCQHPPGQGLPPSRGTGHTQEGTQGRKKRMKKLCQAEQDQHLQLTSLWRVLRK